MSLDSSDPIDLAFPDETATAAYSGGDPIDEAFKEVQSKEEKDAAYSPVPALKGAVGVGENLLSGITGGAGSLADALTGSYPGTHDWAYRPRTDAGKEIQKDLGSAAGAAGNIAYDKVLGPAISAAGGNEAAAKETLKAYVPEALGAVGTVSGLGGLAKSALGDAGAATAADATGEVSSAADRAALLKRVGVTETRKSVLDNDPQAGANEYQESKLNSPNGTRLKGVIDNERQALSDHADRIVADTGGTEGSAADESTRVERGNNILKPLDDLKAHFDQTTKALYDQADQRAAGTPVSLNSFKDVLGDDSEMTNSDRVHLRQGLNSYLTKLKMGGEDGSVSGTVQQAETVRKYLNENWSPQNSKLVGKLKDAIDDDVTQSAGSDIYAQARQMRALRARTLDDPNGISKLMDSSGPEGINRKVPVEKVADTITSLPVVQLNHVIGTLKNLPPELQESGNAALNEIKAHMASKIADTGQKTQSLWNAKGVSQALSQNSARMQAIFSPEEMAKFGDLDAAGTILKKDQSYPGAAVQEHNLVRTGAMAAIRGGATAAGAHLGPIGAVAGEYLGGKAAGKINDAALRKSVESRIVQLSSQ
jgi:hypothetical protein